MRFVSYRDAEGRERCGVVVDDEIRAFEPGVQLIDVLGDLPEAGTQAAARPAEVVPLETAVLLAPVPHPPTVRDFYAFEQHVKTAREARGLEMDPDWYELPVFYFSNPYCVVGPYDSVVAPAGCVELDYELEVAAVISRAGADLDPETAEQHIAGFCIMNDWSARDVQRREMKLSLGPAKGKDFATSLGPLLVTPDELEPHRQGKAYDLLMRATVVGRGEYTLATLAALHWSFGEMIAYASRDTRVEPGDVIGSGTCGTGCILELSLVHGHERYPWLQAGDEVVLTVEQLGHQRARVESRREAE